MKILNQINPSKLFTCLFEREAFFQIYADGRKQIVDSTEANIVNYLFLHINPDFFGNPPDESDLINKLLDSTEPLAEPIVDSFILAYYGYDVIFKIDKRINNGGNRENSGRKSISPKLKKQIISIRLRPDAITKLDSLTDNRSQFIEHCIYEQLDLRV